MPFNFGHHGLRALSPDVDPVDPSFGDRYDDYVSGPLHSGEDRLSILQKRLDLQDALIRDLKNDIKSLLESSS